MLGHSACDSVAQNPNFVIVDKTCGSSGNCRYPDEVCVLSSGASSFFDSNSGNDYSCKQVPSACQDAVKREEASSGGSSSGGSSSGRTTTTRRPATRTTNRPTSAPSTRAPSGGGGGGRDPRCNEEFGVRGSFQRGARFSRRYGYNPSTRKCEQFIYLGTGGTRNNFATAAECQSKCDEGSNDSGSSGSSSGGSANPCTLPPRQGQYTRGKTCSNGARLQRRWTFENGSCRFFFYSGCDGNANNFTSDDECEQRCGRRG